MDRLLLRSLFTLPVHLKNKHYVLTFIFKKPTKIVEQALVYGLGYHYSLSRNRLACYLWTAILNGISSMVAVSSMAPAGVHNDI